MRPPTSGRLDGCCIGIQAKPDREPVPSVDDVDRQSELDLFFLGKLSFESLDFSGLRRANASVRRDVVDHAGACHWAARCADPVG
jgi:hypothetical protein